MTETINLKEKYHVRIDCVDDYYIEFEQDEVLNVNFNVPLRINGHNGIVIVNPANIIKITITENK